MYKVMSRNCPCLMLLHTLYQVNTCSARFTSQRAQVKGGDATGKPAVKAVICEEMLLLCLTCSGAVIVLIVQRRCDFLVA